MAKNCSEKSRVCGDTCIKKSYKCRFDPPATSNAGLTTLATAAKKTKAKAAKAPAAKAPDSTVDIDKSAEDTARAFTALRTGNTALIKDLFRVSNTYPPTKAAAKKEEALLQQLEPEMAKVKAARENYIKNLEDIQAKGGVEEVKKHLEKITEEANAKRLVAADLLSSGDSSGLDKAQYEARSTGIVKEIAAQYYKSAVLKQKMQEETDPLKKLNLELELETQAGDTPLKGDVADQYDYVLILGSSSPAKIKKAAEKEKTTSEAKIEGIKKKVQAIYAEQNKEYVEKGKQARQNNSKLSSASKQHLDALVSVDTDQNLRDIIESDISGEALKSRLNSIAGVGFDEELTVGALMSRPEYASYRQAPQIVRNADDVAKQTKIYGFRGIKEGDGIAENFAEATADDYFVGKGVYGDGNYVATAAKGFNNSEAASTAEWYAGKDGSVFAVGLKTDAKVMDAESYKKLRDKLKRANVDTVDPAAVAMSLGYDGVMTAEMDTPEEKHMIVFNRSKCVTSPAKKVGNFTYPKSDGNYLHESDYDSVLENSVQFSKNNHNRKVARLKNAAKGMDDNQATAVAAYISPLEGLKGANAKETAFQYLNRALYNPSSVTNNDIKAMAKDMVAGISKLPSADWGLVAGKYNDLETRPEVPPTLRRVMNLGDGADAFLSQFTEGKDWRTKGLMSTTVGAQSDFLEGKLKGNWTGGDVEIVITPKLKGTGGKPMDDYKNEADEGEILFNAGTKFKVKSKRFENGRNIVELEES